MKLHTRVDALFFSHCDQHCGHHERDHSIGYNGQYHTHLRGAPPLAFMVAERLPEYAAFKVVPITLPALASLLVSNMLRLIWWHFARLSFKLGFLDMSANQEISFRRDWRWCWWMPRKADESGKGH